MNFLTLCQTLARESGASSSTLTTVTGAIGENLRFVEWIRRANSDIQSLWANWKFNFAQSSDTTSIGVSINTAPSDLESWDRSRFKIDGEVVPSIDYAEWSDFGAVSSGKPSQIVVMPNNSLMFVPTPDAIYTVTGDYYLSPQELTDNADIPRIPETYHDVIWLYALVNYAYYEAADEVLQRAKDRLMERLPRLESSQLPMAHNHAWSNPNMIIEVS
jgi:hypothetical protein